MSKNKPTYDVGYHYTNKQGFDVEVVEYRGRKDIDVMFSDGSIVKGTTGSYIKAGLPLHPSFGKIREGDTFPCKDGDMVTVVEYISSSKIKARWESDGAEKWTSSETLRAGINKHPHNWKYKEGDIVSTNNHGNVEVIQYISATNIVVKFSDGQTKKVTSANLDKGIIRPDNFYKSRIGTDFTTNSGWKGVVINWKNVHDIEVKWQDGSTAIYSWNDIKIGSIKPLFQPSVAGVGYVGDGQFLPASYKLEGTNKTHVDQRIYAYWQRMINRCYNEKEQQKSSSKAYIDCEVEKEWHNFQNFAEWAISKKQCFMFDERGEIWELDKDCLQYCNRIYSASTCTFLPAEINIILADSPRYKGLPRGVNYIKPATAGSKEGYIARCHVYGERKYLGYYNDEMVAFHKYKEFKESVIKQLAEKYKHQLEEIAYHALYNYQVLPYD